MRKLILKSSLLIATIFTLLSFEMPEDWTKAGSKADSYDMGIDIGAGKDGKNAATIKSIEKKIEGFGTLMQQIKPEKYLGKRVRMTGLVKSQDVKNIAALWLRVDQSDSKKPLSFDNMNDRPIKASTDWTKYEIVLDVPENASLMAYGALLAGTGQIWFDNIEFEIVGNNIPTTGVLNNNKTPIPNEPSNLNFEE